MNATPLVGELWVQVGGGHVELSCQDKQLEHLVHELSPTQEEEREVIGAAQATPEAHLHCLQRFSVRRTAWENQLSQHRRRTTCLACVLLGQKSPAIGNPVIGGEGGALALAHILNAISMRYNNETQPGLPAQDGERAEPKAQHCILRPCLRQKSLPLHPSVNDVVEAVVTNITRQGVYGNIGTGQKALLRLPKARKLEAEARAEGSVLGGQGQGPVNLSFLTFLHRRSPRKAASWRRRSSILPPRQPGNFDLKPFARPRQRQNGHEPRARWAPHSCALCRTPGAAAKASEIPARQGAEQSIQRTPRPRTGCRSELVCKLYSNA